MKIINYLLKNEKEEFAKLGKNQKFAKLCDKNKGLSLTPDGKSLYSSAMVDKDSHYPGIEKNIFLLQINSKTFQSSSIFEFPPKSKVRLQLFCELDITIG